MAYSGNIFYGTSVLLPAPPADPPQSPTFSYHQAGVLDSDDVNSQWEFALASNVIIAAIDVASVLVDIKDFLGSERLAPFVTGILVDVGKAISDHAKPGRGPQCGEYFPAREKDGRSRAENGYQ